MSAPLVLLRNRRIHTSPTYTVLDASYGTVVPTYPVTRIAIPPSASRVDRVYCIAERPRQQTTADRSPHKQTLAFRVRSRTRIRWFFGSHPGCLTHDGRGEIEKREVGRACSSLHPQPSRSTPCYYHFAYAQLPHRRALRSARRINIPVTTRLGWHSCRGLTIPGDLERRSVSHRALYRFQTSNAPLAPTALLASSAQTVASCLRRRPHASAPSRNAPSRAPWHARSAPSSPPARGRTPPPAA